MIVIYNYIFNEQVRLHNDLYELTKYLDTYKSSSGYIYDFWYAKVRAEVFEEFSRVILDLLRFYES